MACGDRVEIQIITWVWCLKWGFIPWRCKKTVTVTRYHYVFLPWRTVFAFFQNKYNGCCGNTLYEWSTGFAFFGTGNGPWVFEQADLYLESTATSIGDCPFKPGNTSLG
jgi:hypothetical protein